MLLPIRIFSFQGSLVEFPDFPVSEIPGKVFPGNPGESLDIPGFMEFYWAKTGNILLFPGFPGFHFPVF